MIYGFGRFTLDTDRLELAEDGAAVKVEPQVFAVLRHLIEHRDRVVSKDELIEAVWQGRIVSDATLDSRINAVRRAVGDSGKAQAIIKTVPKRGFRFVADLSAADDNEAPAATERHTESADARPSMVVLPFANLSKDSEQDYFVDGITEDLTSSLSRLRWLTVIARNSAFAFRGEEDLRRIADELGVRYVLTGSVRRIANKMRVTARLSEGSSEVQLWAEQYGGEIDDVFTVQEEVAQSVAGAIGPELLAAEGMRYSRPSGETIDGWAMVMRGLASHWRISNEGSAEAISILEAAAARFPDYATAQSVLAFAILFSCHMGWSPAADLDRALDAAKRGFAIDSDDPWALLAMGYHGLMLRRTDEAVAACGRAIELNPNFAAAFGYRGFANVFGARTEAAIPDLQTAIRLSPKDPQNALFTGAIGVGHYLEGRFEEALTWTTKGVLLRPTFVGGQRIHCAALAMAGRLDEARSTLAAIKALQPDVSIAVLRKTVPYATGRTMDLFLEGLRRAGLAET